MSYQSTLVATPEEPSGLYPPRSAARERETLHADDALSLAALSHYGWAGTRDLRDGARILIAGVGNGDTTVLLAEQARDSKLEIIAIDENPEAIALSKARLAKRGLTHVVHHTLPLLSLPEANLGEFDVIVSRHVLDHLEDPIAGLQAYGAVLKDEGIMAITLNANYGRLQLYMVQALVKHLVEEFMPREMKIQIVQEFLHAIPADHWMGHDSADFVAEINRYGDRAIEALFLQPHNHNFTALEIYQMLDSCGLALTSFMGKAKADYKIETNTASPAIRELLASKMEYERDIIADIMHGGIREHQFYAAIQDKIPAEFADDMVITLAPSIDTHAELLDGIAKTPNSDKLLSLIDGNRAIGEIVSAELKSELKALYDALHLRQRAFLRHKDIKPYATNAEIQARLVDISPITYQ